MNKKTDDDNKGFKISVEDKWVMIRARHGLVIGADLLISTLEKLHSMKAYRIEKAASLWDFRGCRSDLDFEKMSAVKTFIEVNYDRGWAHRLTAFVVDHDLLYGLARMYEMIAEKIPTTIRIFKDMEQAENWLGEEIMKCLPGMDQQDPNRR